MSDDTQKQIKLKPCPFCGGKAEVTKHYTGIMWQLSHRCTAIGFVSSGWVESEKSAAQGWNTRHGK